MYFLFLVFSAALWRFYFFWLAVGEETPQQNAEKRQVSGFWISEITKPGSDYKTKFGKVRKEDFVDKLRESQIGSWESPDIGLVLERTSRKVWWILEESELLRKTSQQNRKD